MREHDEEGERRRARGGGREIETHRYWMVFSLQKFCGICPEILLSSKILQSNEHIDSKLNK